MNLNELAKMVYEIAEEKGWHEKEVSFGDAMINVHAEISEAWEDYRENKPLDHMYYINFKPCGIPSEMADIIIRILDTCYMYGINIQKAFDEKCQYNKTRSYRHGGKKV